MHEYCGNMHVINVGKIFKCLLIFNLSILSSVKCYTSLPKFNTFTYEGAVKLKFESCNKYGWTCQYADGEMSVVFNCPPKFEEKFPEVKWTFEGLPPNAKQLTLQNCDLKLIIDEEHLYKLNKFKIRNITELVITPRRHEVYLKAKRNNATRMYENRVSILNIESIKFIRPLIFGTIWGEFEEVSIRKSKIASLEWHAFHKVKAMVFNFNQNEVLSVKEGAFSLNANRVNIVDNKFHHLDYGAFFDINIGDDQNEMVDNDNDDYNIIRPNDVNCDINCQPVISFEFNTIESSDVGGLHFGKPNSYTISMKSNIGEYNNSTSTNNTNAVVTEVPKYNIFVHNNKFNCIQIKWLFDAFVNADEEDEKKKKAQEKKKQIFDEVYPFVLYYVIENEDNVCYNLDCDDFSLGLYKDRYFIYGPDNDICNNTYEFKLTNSASIFKKSIINIFIIFYNIKKVVYR